MADKYNKLEEDQPPQYNEVANQPMPPPMAPPVLAPNAPVYTAPPAGYMIQGNQSAPVVGQPQVVYVQAPVIPEHEAPDHLVMAILVTVCCCLPLGVVAILKSSECRAARMRGDRENAVTNSQQAKKFSLLGLGIGLGLIVITLVLYGIIIGIALSNAGPNQFNP